MTTAPEQPRPDRGEEPMESSGWRLLAVPWLGLLLAAATAAFGLLVLPRLPARVPTHWGLDGQPNGWMPPAAAVWFMPILIAGTWALLMGIARLTGSLFRSAVEVRAYRVTVNMVLAFMAVMQGVVLWSALTGGGVDVTRWVMVLVGLLFVLIARLMPHLPNRGINLPGFDSDSDYGRRLTTFVQADFTIGGVLLMAAMLLPGGLRDVVAFTLILVVSVLPLGYLLVRPPRLGKRGGGSPSSSAGAEPPDR